MMGGEVSIDENGLLIALRHPLRRRILRAMAARPQFSPREVADDLREPLSNVSYHVRVLAACGAITLVNTAPVRGSVQHFYSCAIKQPWALAVLGLGGNGGLVAGGESDEPNA